MGNRLDHTWASLASGEESGAGVGDARRCVIEFLSCALAMAAILLVLLQTQRPNSIEEVRFVTQSLPTQSSSPHGTHGFFIMLPAPAPEVEELIERGWQLDASDNKDSPIASGHDIIVNGLTLQRPHSIHAEIGTSADGSYSIWGPDIRSAGVYASLPEGSEELESCSIRWRLKRETSPHGVGATSLIFWSALCAGGCASLFLVGQRFRGTWQTLPLTVPGGLAGGAVLATLLAGSLNPGGASWMAHAIENLVGCILGLVLVGAAAFALHGYRSDQRLAMSTMQIGVLLLTLATSCATLLATWWNIGSTTSWYDQQGPASTMLAGRMPFSDAFGWYTGVCAVVDGQEVEWAARRPIHTLIRAGELVIAGKGYQPSLLIQAVLVSLCITGLVAAVWQCIGPGAAMAAWAGMITAVEGYIPSYLSESTGIGLACISLGFLIVGTAHGMFRARLAGYCLLMMASLVRPGPFTLLAVPPIVEWLAGTAGHWRRIAVTVITMAAAYAGGLATFQLIKSPTAMMNANAAHSAYGFAIGERWDIGQQRFFEKDPGRQKLPVPQQTALMMEEACELLVRDPRPALNRLKVDLIDGIGHLVLGFPGPAFPLSFNMNIVRTLFMVIASVGWVLWFRVDRLPASMLMLWILGLIAALPLGWRDVGQRGYVIAVPAIVCWLALPFAANRWWGKRLPRPNGTALPMSLTVATISLGITLLIGTTNFGLRAFGHPHPDDAVVVDPSRDPVIFVTDDPQAKSDPFGPMTIRRADLLHAMAPYNMYGYADYLSQIPVPFVIASAKNSDLMLVVEGADASAPIEIETLVPSPNPYFRQATSWRTLKQSLRP